MEDLNLNYGCLKEIISDRVGSQTKVAKELGISMTALCNKLNNRTPFKHSEIIKISEFLHLSDTEISRCFFIRK